ncbi:MAG TPA: endopeptidase La, partial [Treponema sp.]|nr:endopeptidase La [Treponema sp.]
MKDKTEQVEPENLPAEQQFPNKLFLIPIAGRPIFPGVFTPLMISNSNAEDAKVVEEAYEGDGFIGIVMLKDEVEKPSVNDLYKVGTVARIIKKINLPDGGVNVFVSTLQRFKIRKTLNSSGPMVAAVEYIED